MNMRKLFIPANAIKLLLILFLAVFIYTIYDLSVFVMSRLLDMDKARYTKEKGRDEANGASKEERLPLAHYLQDIEKKDLFKSVIIEKAGAAAPAPGTAAKQRSEEVIKNFILKGVIAGPVPQAVVEDTKQGKTYFVVKSDRIADMVVEDITDNKVTLKFGEQSFDLTL